MLELSKVTVVYKAEDGTLYRQPLADIMEVGTPIDPETGDDLEMVGAEVAEVEDVEGCSCGMADKGAPGHVDHKEG